MRRFESELLAGGIDRVTITGLPEERIAIELPSAALETLGLSLVDVGERVAQISRDVPAGVAGEQDGAREIRGLEQRRNALAFDNVAVVSDDRGRITLGELAAITREPRPGSLALSEGGDVVVEMQLQRAESGHSLKAAQAFDAWLQKTRPSLPASVKLEVFDAQWELIRDRIQLLINNGLSGLLVVVLVLYAFLPARVAFWVMVGIPTAFLATLGLMLVFGGTINMMSLFALIMALGIIVDDAIVVSEDADTHRSMGEGPEQSALGGARRMLLPVLAASLTTVAAFIPLMMIGGIIGNILGDIPFVMIMVIMASLLESFLILPSHLKHALQEVPRHARPRVCVSVWMARSPPFATVLSAARRRSHSTGAARPLRSPWRRWCLPSACWPADGSTSCSSPPRRGRWSTPMRRSSPARHGRRRRLSWPTWNVPCWKPSASWAMAWCKPPCLALALPSAVVRERHGQG